MLKIENLNVFYGSIQALYSLSLEVPQGAIVSLVGANGAGKSTLLNSIAGLQQPRNGSIRWCGTSHLQQRSQIRATFNH